MCPENVQVAWTPAHAAAAGLPIYATPPARPTLASVIARTARKGPRTAVLGGWAVILAALIFGSASSGAVSLAAEAGATDGAGTAYADVAILAPAGGAAYRAGEPVALRGGARAGGEALTGTALRWTVLRHAGAVVEQVAEATGKEASFVPAPGSADVTYEIRLTVGISTVSVTMHAADSAPGTPPLRGVGPSLTESAPAFGIDAPVRFSGPVLWVDSGPKRGDDEISGTVDGLATGSRIEVAVRRGGRAAGCRWWSARARRFVRGSCSAPRVIVAAVARAQAGHATWYADLRAPLPPGRNVLVLRIRDHRGTVVPLTRR